ncbi:MAG: GTP-binding protein [Candidatus Methanomethylicaceae archaeon]|nr:GTP-binding protein [Candidatus Verstraetearchaeota archaeon]
MKVIQLAGFLGSGKTTAIIAISRRIASDGKKVAIIVNEIGDVPVDAKIVSEYGLNVRDIGGGCICCELLVSLAYTLEELAKSHSPDYVFIEPSGVSIPSSIKNGIGFVKSFDIECGPVIVLFDGERGQEQLMDEDLGKFIKRQLAGGDIVAINKIDILQEELVRSIEVLIKTINQNARIIRISAKKGTGLDELVGLIA